MTRLLDPMLLDSHDFYHARYGRGAVIVAIERDTEAAPSQDRAKWHLHVARLYSGGNRSSTSIVPDFEPVLSLQEEAGLVRIMVQFEYRHPRNPTYNPVSATIERVIPAAQVTLEIVRSAARDKT